MSALLGKATRELPELRPRPSVRPRTATTSFVALAALVITFVVSVSHKYIWLCLQGGSVDPVDAAICPQAPELIPTRNNALWGTLTETYGTEAFRSRAIQWLSGAIQIPTESYDQMDPVGIDQRWEKFALFHDYLAKSFPLVHSALELTKVDTYGLIFVWKGSDTALKPLLLAAHQDVVPMDPTTYDDWTYPPFSGYFDGKLIWGRGAADNKNGLIGILSAMETMLEGGYEPARTVVLASGFDEESSGEYRRNSWRCLAKMDTLDEGAGYGEQYGRVVGTPGIAEKGAVNVMIEVTTTGGHSSLPPSHTSIGLLAEFLVTIEKNPFDVHLIRGSPMYKNFQCLARHTPDLPDSLRRHLIAAEHSDTALRSAEKELLRDATTRNLVGTTQAIDLVSGGVKVNALPERAYAVVNHRIAVESSVAATLSRDARLLKSLARYHNLSYTAFDVGMNEDVNATCQGTVTLSTAFEDGLEPAPVSPTDDAVPYRLLSGSIKAAYNTHRGISGDEGIIVSPGIMSRNTDTRFYWKLTPHIFRYGHVDYYRGCTPSMTAAL